MTQVSLVGERKDCRVDMQLVKNGRPTPLLIGLAAAELAVDCAVAFAAFNIFRLLKK